MLLLVKSSLYIVKEKTFSIQWLRNVYRNLFKSFEARDFEETRTMEDVKELLGPFMKRANSGRH